MKIILYLKPGDDPNKVAEEARRIVESNTGKQCTVRITGDAMRSDKPLSEATLGY